jgi:hypothetical protein
MTEGPIQIPDALRAAIARDLQPVRPLGPPSKRVLLVVPVAVALLFASTWLFGLRRDAPVLRPWLTWTASTLQMLLGLALIAAALREAVPGTTLSRRALGVVFGTAAIAVLSITITTWGVSPTTIAPGFVRYVWSVCVAGGVLSALPVLAVSGWLAARAFPLRPRIAGAVYGLGAGLIADAGWRLFCHFSDPSHVLGAHALAIVVIALLGSRVSGSRVPRFPGSRVPRFPGFGL